MSDTGILYRGAVLPGTDWVVRDPRAWWADGDRGTVRQIEAPRVIVGHWGGGAAHEGPSAALRQVRNMKAREDEVSCHFSISWDGIVTQTADLATGTIHCSRLWNRTGVGVETCWPGTEAQARRLGLHGGAVLPRRVLGSGVRVYEPSDDLVAAWVRLAETLAAALAIPRVVAPAERAMTAAEAREFRGAAEHYSTPYSVRQRARTAAGKPSGKKIDAAGLLLDALVARGWQR